MGNASPFREVVRYFFRKKNTALPSNAYLKAMHFINKFSIAAFLLAVLYLITKHLFL